MSFPLITDYTNAMRNARSRFNTLNLVPILDDKGAPIILAGNFAAIYKATNKDTGQVVAVKCFIRDMPDLKSRYGAVSTLIARS
ncbi:MAG: protein kinase family protein, partial [Alphaproteobacteria bacterium]|nr:protein kinase family protein [Alphaproteobacteria bacterium]